jgi:hypothetical protein
MEVGPFSLEGIGREIEVDGKLGYQFESWQRSMRKLYNDQQRRPYGQRLERGQETGANGGDPALTHHILDLSNLSQSLTHIFNLVNGVIPK